MFLPRAAMRARGLTVAAGAVLCVLSGGPGHAQLAPPRAVVGPNMLVSRDGDSAHIEIMAAANPRNPKQLVAGVITATRPAGGWAVKAYASGDGGNTWIDSTFPEQVENGGADPQVVFTEDGAALLAALSWVTDEKGHLSVALVVHRSEDGGRTWDKGVVAATGVDHPQITVDHTGGPHNGRIYMGYLHNAPPKDPKTLDYRVSVISSDDGGCTFGKPILVADGKGEVGINVVGVRPLSDGSVVVSWLDFDYHQSRTPRTEQTSHVFTAISQDGGETFSEPRLVGTELAKLSPWLSTFPEFGSDASGGKYRDRLYAVWSDYSSGEDRVVFTWSSDKGATWSKPVILDGSGDPGSAQYQGQVAVNGKGVVGVSWLDTRTKDLGRYDEYFTASSDGGRSFMRPVRVSSTTSDMFGVGNAQVVPTTWHFQNVVRVSFTSPETRWRTGGDYWGLVSDANGVFHPVWADSRSGTFQVWTAAVETGDAALATPRADAQAADVTSQIDVVTDPARYDPAMHVLEMPLRLQNRTGKILYGPVTATVSLFGSGMGDVNRDFAPEVLNATNHKPGAGAEMDYTAALGGAGALTPDGVTDAVVWRLKISDPEKVPDMHLSVKAAVGGAAPK
jgi:hypothetical protein